MGAPDLQLARPRLQHHVQQAVAAARGCGPRGGRDARSRDSGHLQRAADGLLQVNNNIMHLSLLMLNLSAKSLSNLLGGT